MAQYLGHERRNNSKLRALFDEMLQRVEPCFAKRPPRGLPLEWVVFRTARAAYPQLTPLDLYQFAMASTRKRRARRTRSNLRFA